MNSPNHPAKPTITPDDVLFVVLRHKWKISAFVLLGLLVAAGLWVLRKPVYQSRAQLLVRYVTETRNVLKTGPGDPEVVRDPDARGVTIISSEVSILTSQDSLLAVARDTGPEKILAAYSGGTNVYDAAAVLASNLKIQAPPNSSVITVFVGHRDPEIARRALEGLVREYLQRHIDIHRSFGTSDLLQSQTDQLRARLAETERELNREKSKANIISLEQAKTDVAALRNSILKEIRQSEANVAELRALLGIQVASGERSSTNTPASAGGTNDTAVASRRISTRDQAAYQRLTQSLASLQTKESELLGTFQESSGPVVQLRAQIKEVERALSALGVDPDALDFSAVSSSLSNHSPNLEHERAKLTAAEAKLSTLRRQLEEVVGQAKLIDSVESPIMSLQRRKELDEEKLRYFESNLERVRFDQAVDSGKANNISLIEAPTAAALAQGKLYKVMAGAFAACAFVGLALAFLIEFVFDPTYKRPKDVESNLQVPVFVSVPDFKTNSRSKFKVGQGDSNSMMLANGEIPPWDENDPMLPYYEAIRDRVVMSYAGDSHKPKVVGLTSCGIGAGVSRLSAGLAAALSRDFERNVLYIGLERNKVSVTAFAKGRPAAEAAGEASESESLLDGAVARVPFVNQGFDPNLLSLATTGRNLAGASIVQSFCDLMPKLKVSDYDYVIFDLPPITQTSGSLRLAAQMERTLLVVEAEMTPKAAVQKAEKMLASARANFAVVLNKAKPYGVES